MPIGVLSSYINRKSYEDKKSRFMYDGYSISPGQLQ